MDTDVQQVLSERVVPLLQLPDLQALRNVSPFFREATDSASDDVWQRVARSATAHRQNSKRAWSGHSTAQLLSLVCYS